MGIVEQLSAHSPQAETELLRGIEPAADGTREMPALLFDLLGMEPFADRMLSHPRWRPVYFDDTAIIFLHEPQAEALGRPAVDRAELARFYQNLRLVKKYGWSQLRSVN